jgi:DNA-directed RNA polymerase specialized sigma24 family protein
LPYSPSRTGSQSSGSQTRSACPTISSGSCGDTSFDVSINAHSDRHDVPLLSHQGKLAPCCSAPPDVDGLVGYEDDLVLKVDEDIDGFVRDAEPRLRRALIAAVGTDRVDDAVGESLAYAAEHWDDLRAMDNPVGYLFRVGQSKSRPRKRPPLFRREPQAIPEVEPGLPDALRDLPDAQRIAVWLAHGCDWTHADIADVLGVGTSTVATHVSRALARLRSDLGVMS